MGQWSTWSGSFDNWIDEEPAPEKLEQLVQLVRGLNMQLGVRIHPEVWRPAR
jgi:hypothetical protein